MFLFVHRSRPGWQSRQAEMADESRLEDLDPSFGEILALVRPEAKPKAAPKWQQRDPTLMRHARTCQQVQRTETRLQRTESELDALRTQ